MGCCQSAADDAAVSRQWDNELRNDRKKSQKIHKLLLLGTGNSGKSTFFKQLTQIHGGGFQDNEFHNAKHIQDHVVVQMKALLQTFKDQDDDDFKIDLPAELQAAAHRVDKLNPEQLLASVADDIKLLWDHDTIKQAYSDRTNLGIADSAPHFLEQLDRVNSPDYRPTTEDILLARIPTTGMRDKMFTIKDTMFKIYDVGGQRSERNKWIHCFDAVHGILFVASLSCYDQHLFEENELNAMTEALNLFNIVANSRYFLHASLILFLNKSDLFAQKIVHKPLTLCFPEYEGENTFVEASEYISTRFKSEMSKRDRKNLYTHVTCATDSDNVEKVFDDVQHTIVQNALRYNGLI